MIGSKIDEALAYYAEQKFNRSCRLTCEALDLINGHMLTNQKFFNIATTHRKLILGPNRKLWFPYEITHAAIVKDQGQIEIADTLTYAIREHVYDFGIIHPSLDWMPGMSFKEAPNGRFRVGAAMIEGLILVCAVHAKNRDDRPKSKVTMRGNRGQFTLDTCWANPEYVAKLLNE